MSEEYNNLSEALPDIRKYMDCVVENGTVVYVKETWGNDGCGKTFVTTIRKYEIEEIKDQDDVFITFSMIVSNGVNYVSTEFYASTTDIEVNDWGFQFHGKISNDCMNGSFQITDWELDHIQELERKLEEEEKHRARLVDKSYLRTSTNLLSVLKTISPETMIWLMTEDKSVDVQINARKLLKDVANDGKYGFVSCATVSNISIKPFLNSKGVLLLFLEITICNC